MNSDHEAWQDFTQPDGWFPNPLRAMNGALHCVPGVSAVYIAVNSASRTVTLTDPSRLLRGPPLELPPACVCVVVYTFDDAPLTDAQRQEIAQILGDHLPVAVNMIGSEEAEWTGYEGDRRIVRWFDETLGGRNPYFT